MAEVGERVGSYVLERRLGAGATAEVWLARDVVDRAVVVKIFDEQHEDLASREVSGMRRCGEEGVPRFLNSLIVGERRAVVMEFVEGRPWSREQRSWAELEPLVMGVLTTLAAVHARGLAHGDLKPDNVLVSDDGVVSIVDFGFATPELVPSKPVGTPDYMAPEVLRRAGPGPASDLYALALMVFEVLYGRPAHPATDLPGLLRARLMSLALVFEGVPEPFASVLSQCSMPRAVDRPSSASAALAALRGEGMPWDDLPEVSTELELRALFHGPEAVLHLPSDSAAELFSRTGGCRARVVEELKAWMGRSLARLDGAKLRVERNSLARLYRLPLLGEAESDVSGLDGELLEIGGYGYPAIPEDVLVRVSRAEAGAVSEALARLEVAGLARRHRLGWRFFGHQGTPDTALVGRIFEALPDGHLTQLAWVDIVLEPLEAAKFLTAEAMRLDEDGATTLALDIYREATSRFARHREAQNEVIVAWAGLAILVLNMGDLETLAWWLDGRTEMADVASLVEARIQVSQGAAFDVPERAEGRTSMLWLASASLMFASQKQEKDAADMLVSLAEAAERRGDLDAAATVRGWELHREADLERGRWLYEFAMKHKRRRSGRLMTQTHWVSAMRDYLEPQERVDILSSVWAESHEYRLDAIEGHATYRLRTARFLLGEVKNVDYELLTYADHAGMYNPMIWYLLEGMVALDGGDAAALSLLQTALDAYRCRHGADFQDWRYFAEVLLAWLEPVRLKDLDLAEMARATMTSNLLNLKIQVLGLLRLLGYEGPEIEEGRQMWEAWPRRSERQFLGYVDVVWTHAPCFGDVDCWTPRGLPIPAQRMVSTSA